MKLQLLKLTLIIVSLFAVLVVATAPGANENLSTISEITSEKVDQGAQLNHGEQNLGLEACNGKNDAHWNDGESRCECLGNPARFSGNPWLIRNSLQCS